jgi:hypothetical protein
MAGGFPSFRKISGVHVQRLSSIHVDVHDKQYRAPSRVQTPETKVRNDDSLDAVYPNHQAHRGVPPPEAWRDESMV